MTCEKFVIGGDRTAISLFTGAGGLDTGLERAGFGVRLCVEIDPEARATIRANHPSWRFSDHSDIHQCKPGELLKQSGLKPRAVRLLTGGPPCQPWSKSAQWCANGAARLGDPRALTLRAYLDVVEAVLPEVVLLENVPGLVSPTRDDGLSFIRERLEKVNRKHGSRYRLQILRVNAADYGVPQQRERAFLLAHRKGAVIELPGATHGPGRSSNFRTAWDAIGHLDTPAWDNELAASGKWARLLPSIPEGKNYLWHTNRGGGLPLFGWRTRYWSFLLKLSKHQPSWTLQADPGPATGPFHWRNRELSIEEMAALQTFPERYKICGGRRSAIRQIGNAVPCSVGELLGLEIRRQLFQEKRVPRRLRMIPEQRTDRPRAHPRRPVHPDYRLLQGRHEDHLGHGLGPGRV